MISRLSKQAYKLGVLVNVCDFERQEPLPSSNRVAAFLVGQTSELGGIFSTNPSRVGCFDFDLIDWI